MRVRRVWVAAALLFAATMPAAAQSQLSAGLYHPQTLRAVGGAQPGQVVLLLGTLTVQAEVTGVQAILRLPDGTRFAGQLRAPPDTRTEYSVDGAAFSAQPGPDVRAVRFTLARCRPGLSYPLGFAVQVSRAR